jgi:hypothetical protein
VWAVVVEVAYVLVEDGAGGLFVVDQHLVGAFFADAADEPFCITVGPRRVGRDLDYVEPFGGKNVWGSNIGGRAWPAGSRASGLGHAAIGYSLVSPSRIALRCSW